MPRRFSDDDPSERPRRSVVNPPSARGEGVVGA
jgi:hypothetical protein